MNSKDMKKPTTNCWFFLYILLCIKFLETDEILGYSWFQKRVKFKAGKENFCEPYFLYGE